MKIGFRKVGFSLKYIADAKPIATGITVTGYYSRHEDSARSAAEFTGSRFYSNPEELLKESGAFFDCSRRSNSLGV